MGGSPRKPVLRRLERAVFEPHSLPPQLVTGLALAPPILAGLVLFRLQAAIALAVAVAVGGAAHGAVRVLGSRVRVSPVVPALFGVALMGPHAPLTWLLAVAAAAALLELTRARLFSVVPLETGVVAFALVLVAHPAAAVGYVSPVTGGALDEPIRLWLDATPVSSPLLDPLRLYLGQVAGPVFATSLLAVVVGTAWAWYARRVSVWALTGFLVGALAPVVVWRWPPLPSLESGPIWFLAALVLADTSRLPRHRSLQATIGLVAGAAAFGVRGHHVVLAGSLLALVAVHAAVAITVAVRRLTTRPEPRPHRPAQPQLPAAAPRALPPPGGRTS